MLFVDLKKKKKEKVFRTSFCYSAKLIAAICVCPDKSKGVVPWLTYRW